MGGGSSLDLTPDAFSFVDQTNVDTATVTVSAPVTMAGLIGSAIIIVSGGEYSINGGAYTTLPGLVANGDLVRARHTSASALATATNTVVTVGGVSDTFTSTTHAPVWTSQYSASTLAPLVGSGTPTTTRASNTATVMAAAGTLSTLNANLPAFDYFRGITPDASAFNRPAFSTGSGSPPQVVGGALAGLSFDGLDADDGSQGLNAGVSGFGVQTSDGSMQVKATIRRGRTGAGLTELIVGKGGNTVPTENYILLVTADVLFFEVIKSDGTAVSTIGSTTLSAGVNYTVEGNWTGSVLNIKVNGVQEGATPALTALQAPDSTTPFYIGRQGWVSGDAASPYPFLGTIADVSMTRGGVVQGQWACTTFTPALREEPAAINIALNARDKTNVSWVKGATMTAAKDQTGVDGSANSASSLTGGVVTATNTCLQTVVLASSSRVYSAWVKRITGTGIIEMTTDGGTTWVVVTSKITTAWNRISIPAQTVTNPVFGFRITTNLDKIAVDFDQNETGFLTSNTTAPAGASVTRNADNTFVSTSSVGSFSNTTLAMYAQFIAPNAGIASAVAMSLNGGDNTNIIYMYDASGTLTQNVTTSSVSQANFTLGTIANGAIVKTMMAVAANDFAGVANGGTVSADVSGTVPTVSVFGIGRDGNAAGQTTSWLIANELYATRVNNAGMQNKTT